MDYLNRIMPGGLPDDFSFTSELEEGVLKKIKITGAAIEVCSVTASGEVESDVWEELIIETQTNKKRLKSIVAAVSGVYDVDDHSEPVVPKETKKIKSSSAQDISASTSKSVDP